MDFTDATLVLLANDLGTGDILTLDERGFRTYRFRGSRRFNLVPNKH
jgi:predicted nucleic acid-binding protein